jgi:hypothetical protein
MNPRSWVEIPSFGDSVLAMMGARAECYELSIYTIKDWSEPGSLSRLYLRLVGLEAGRSVSEHCFLSGGCSSATLHIPCHLSCSFMRVLG